MCCMTTRLLMAGACLAVVAAAASAADISGYAEANAGLGYTTIGEHVDFYCAGVLCGAYRLHDQGTSTQYGGIGHANIAFSDGWGVQIDAAGLRNEFIHITQDTTRIGGHLYNRDGDHLLGGYFSYGDFYDSGAITFGIEGQLYLDRITLEAQLGYSTAIDGVLENYLGSAYNLHIGARYFPCDRLMLSGGLTAAYGDGSNDDGYTEAAKITPLQWELKAEYLFEDAPFSLYAAYRGSYLSYHGRTDFGGGDYATAQFANNGATVMIGLRFYFNQGTLFGNDRGGASLEDYNPWYGAQPFSFSLLGAI